MIEELEQSPVIAKIVQSEEITRRELRQRTAHVLLLDGSQLRISEVFMNKRLVKYSYYWLSAQNELIRGWDNAPHHKKISTFPHHVHTTETTEESTIVSLQQVLRYIEKVIK